MTVPTLHHSAAVEVRCSEQDAGAAPAAEARAAAPGVAGWSRCFSRALLGGCSPRWPWRSRPGFAWRRGANPEAVRVLAGHHNPSTTQRYVHATRADLEAAIAKLSQG